MRSALGGGETDGRGASESSSPKLRINMLDAACRSADLGGLGKLASNARIGGFECLEIEGRPGVGESDTLVLEVLAGEGSCAWRKHRAAPARLQA